jgi:hypothetical protein
MEKIKDKKHYGRWAIVCFLFWISNILSFADSLENGKNMGIFFHGLGIIVFGSWCLHCVLKYLKLYKAGKAADASNA